jgi:ribose transport system substrate-binding protein
MKKEEKSLYLLGGVLIALLAVLTLKQNFTERPRSIYNVSVIVNDRSAARWANARRGMEFAGAEFNVDINFITLYDSNNIEQQQKLFEREIEGDAEAIVVSPVNPDGLSEAANASGGAGIVAIGGAINSDKVQTKVRADDFAAASSLAEIALISGANFFIITQNNDASNIAERIAGAQSVFLRNGGSVEIFKTDETDGLKSFIAENRGEGRAFFIADENALTDAAAVLEEIFLNYGEANVYGIGCGPSVISALENNYIKAVSVPDYFALGYVAIKESVAGIRGEKTETEVVVGSKIIYPDTIYQDENAAFLFPIP